MEIHVVRVVATEAAPARRNYSGSLPSVGARRTRGAARVTFPNTGLAEVMDEIEQLLPMSPTCLAAGLPGP
jgi:hypothetical protein